MVFPPKPLLARLRPHLLPTILLLTYFGVVGFLCYQGFSEYRDRQSPLQSHYVNVYASDSETNPIFGLVLSQTPEGTYLQRADSSVVFIPTSRIFSIWTRD